MPSAYRNTVLYLESTCDIIRLLEFQRNASLCKLLESILLSIYQAVYFGSKDNDQTALIHSNRQEFDDTHTDKQSESLTSAWGNDVPTTRSLSNLQLGWSRMPLRMLSFTATLCSDGELYGTSVVNKTCMHVINICNICSN